MVSRTVFVLATAWASALAAQAPGGTPRVVRGAIADERGPVASAEVRLQRPGLTPTLVAFTDQLGRFEFAAVEDGAWTLSVRRIGYESQTRSIVVGERDSSSLHITLKATPQILDTVAVVNETGVPARYGPSSRMDEFYRRRARARGRFFTREDIEESGRSKLTDLLRTVPGARVTTQPGNLAGGVRALRRPRPARPVGKPLLGRTERGRECAVRRALNACAAIFVWTRFGPG